MPPQLTVLLIRHAESIVDTGEAKRLHETLDPSLTNDGFRDAHQFWVNLFSQQLDDAPRRMACFSAPLMACHSTALLLSAADMPKYETLSWRFTVAETAKTPTAVPIVVHNNLASFAEDYSTLDRILDAGLLHGAAAEWNHAESRKCPLAAKLDGIQTILRDQGDLELWKKDRSVHPPRKVLEAQFLHQADAEHWWSLTPLTAKRNLLVDMLAPNKYLPPPREGNVRSMLDHTADETAHDPVEAVQDCVKAARAAGCDTLLMILPATTIVTALEALAGVSSVDTNPLAMTACTVDTETMEWAVVDGELPPPVSIDCTDIPPEDIDPDSVPPNQWSVFPVPEPENIPDDYPDLANRPPFGMALSKPPPDTKPTTTPLRERSPNNGASSSSPHGRGRGAERGGRGRGRAVARGGGRGPGPAARGGRGVPGGRTAPRAGPVPGRGSRAPVSPTPRSTGRTAPVSPAARSPVRSKGRSPGRSPAGRSPGRFVSPKGRSPVRLVSPNGRKLSPHPPPQSPTREATSGLSAPSLSPRSGPSLTDHLSSPPQFPHQASPTPQSPAPSTPTRRSKKGRKSAAKQNRYETV